MLRASTLWSVCLLSMLWSAGGSVPQALAGPTFEVASVKPARSNLAPSSRFPLGPGDAFVPGGLFSATNQPLIAYLRFAYKLGQGDLLGLPAWVYEDRFDITARAAGNVTKDETRLMMRALLADRFKLAMHTERVDRPVFHLMVAKAGRTGPQLVAHADDGSCSAPEPQRPGAAPPAPPSAPSPTSGLQLPPISCGGIGQILASAPGRGRLGGRGVTIARIAGFLKNPFTGLDRPVLDRTGLTGTFDFTLEWSLAADSAQPPDPSQLAASVEETGPTFLQALRDQLGFKLESAKGAVDVLVIDRVEHPAED